MEERGERVLTSVSLYGVNGSQCGYCGGRSAALGATLHNATPQAYAQWCNSNGRRSGCYWYKPQNLAGCCALYTIRTRAARFTPAHDHRAIAARWHNNALSLHRNANTWIETESPLQMKDENVRTSTSASTSTSTSTSASASCSTTHGNDEELSSEELKMRTTFEMISRTLSECASKTFGEFLDVGKSFPLPSIKTNMVYSGHGHHLGDCYTSFPLSLHAYIEHLSPKKSCPTVNELSEILAKQFTALLSSQIEATANQTGQINFHFNAKEIPFSDVEAVATKKLKQKQKQKQKLKQSKHKMESGSGKLVVTASLSSFSKEEFELYKKYQISVHHDEPSEITEEGYRHFLVDTSLITEPLPNGITFPCGVAAYGSYHMQYRINDVLVAVAVVDIVPTFLSSVYVFYDPDKPWLQLGKLTALWEIEYVATCSKILPDFEFYYMGYYIHNCQKMKYKAQYRPSELLCELTHTWVPITDALLEKLSSGGGKFVALTDCDEEFARQLVIEEGKQFHITQEYQKLVPFCKNIPIYVTRKLLGKKLIPFESLTLEIRGLIALFVSLIGVGNSGNLSFSF
eukprot:TRINITY_DN3499_c0_g1_i1.p1 TRINITY_DN3499_c0_g1~~TRINITY_DN3499_c0_g1_i1.p1  ORF type:complete len:573 (-),score=123.26 TRINITY_DN3499_c0_g1_i1:50-1768(-)